MVATGGGVLHLAVSSDDSVVSFPVIASADVLERCTAVIEAFR
jgi:hypothetical protein